jgi:hypothetical protein
MTRGGYYADLYRMTYRIHDGNGATPGDLSGDGAGANGAGARAVTREG